MLRRGLIGGAGARIAAGMPARRQPAPEITKRELPPNMPPAALAEAIRRQGGDVGLEWALMQQGQAPAMQPAPNPVPARPGLFGSARNRAKAAVANVMPPMAKPEKSGSNGFMGAAMEAAPMIGAPAMAPPTPQLAPMPAQPQVKAGLQAAAQDVAARPAGAFAQGPKPAPAQPVGLWDEIWQDPFTFFLTGTDGLDRKYGRAAEADKTRAAATEMAKLDAMIAGLPQDQQLLWRTNPEEMAKAMASNYEAATLSGGQTRFRGNGAGTFTAPTFGTFGDEFYQQGPDGVSIQGRRATTVAELTDQATQAETERANRADEALGRDRLSFDRGKFDYERTQPKLPEFGDENSFRSQYLGQAKSFQDTARAAASVRSLSPTMNPAEQMALVFQTMKMLDPGSTVREGEYANAQNTTGAMGQLWNFYNKAKDGQFLNEDQIRDFRAMIDGLYNAAEGEYSKTYDFYRGMAPRYGMDPSIIQDFRLAPTQPPSSVGSGAMAAMGAALADAPSASDLGDDELRAILGLD